MMSPVDPAHPLYQLLDRDRRYTLDAYLFVLEALSFAQETLGMGAEPAAEELEPAADFEAGGKPRSRSGRGRKRQAERHVSGQELCEAARRYGLQQYGYLAPTVLATWGIRATDDLGEIVFNMIDIGQMRKTKTDPAGSVFSCGWRCAHDDLVVRRRAAVGRDPAGRGVSARGRRPAPAASSRGRGRLQRPAAPGRGHRGAGGGRTAGAVAAGGRGHRVGALMLLLAARPRLVVYNITLEQLRPVVAEIVAALDPTARWAGETVALPGRGIQVHLDGRGGMRSVSVVALGSRTSAEGWGEFSRRLRQAIRGLRVRPSPWAAVFGCGGCGLLAAAAILACLPAGRDPAAPAPSSPPPASGARHAPAGRSVAA